MVKVSCPAGVPLNSRVGLVVIVLQRKEVVGYRERMYMIWKEKGMFDVKEQRLLDQKWQIATKKWFSDLQLNEIKKK